MEDACSHTVTKMKQTITEKIEIPEGVTVTLTKGSIQAKGPKGELTRAFVDPQITITQEEVNIIFQAKKASKREKRTIGTYCSHLKNMLHGVSEGHHYKLKICSGHFPMNVSVSGDKLNVKNFLGEKIPRVAKILPGADVKVEGDIITIESNDKEAAGQTAANFEQLTRITNRDLRIFQDGIYITVKDGKEIK